MTGGRDNRVAELIIELARLAGAPIREDRDAVALLAALGPGREVPESAYRALAEILAFLHRVNAGMDDRK